MTIHLPEDLERYIKSKIETGRFASEQDAITEALQRLRQSETPPESGAASVPAWKRVLQIMNTVPDTEFETIPVDASEQLDHYVYRTPKRPTR